MLGGGSVVLCEVKMGPGKYRCWTTSAVARTCFGRPRTFTNNDRKEPKRRNARKKQQDRKNHGKGKGKGKSKGRGRARGVSSLAHSGPARGHGRWTGGSGIFRFRRCKRTSTAQCSTQSMAQSFRASQPPYSLQLFLSFSPPLCDFQVVGIRSHTVPYHIAYGTCMSILKLRRRPPFARRSRTEWRN